jgi:hypothetical protein
VAKAAQQAVEKAHNESVALGAKRATIERELLEAREKHNAEIAQGRKELAQ